MIASITPYFLDKGNVWFEEHETEILEAARTQPFFAENVLALTAGMTTTLSDLLRRLDELGYEKVLSAQDPGEFASRGGSVEIFPLHARNALRLEFFGNTIEHIETIDGSTLKDEEKSKDILKKRLKSQKLYSDLRGIKEGDYLVHLDHGVARFTGTTTIQNTVRQPADKAQEYYVLEYARGDKLFVPVGLERKLSRYIGFADPHVARLGSVAWQKTKRRVKAEVETLARSLLTLYATREIAERPPYAPKGEIFSALEHSFPYKETPDQLQAMDDIERDLKRPKPADRIICGDVGFGKTEIALRAMVRAVEQGYQAALLAPTTILAFQHYQTFQERLASLPVRIALLSRLQNKQEQGRVLSRLKSGDVDMVIGTHRALSSDVAYARLGMLVIDDEQRFGVKQKEALREARASLDVLSLSATPIPRTLYMALSSLKTVSLIHTPPPNRMPVDTRVARRTNALVKEAILQELARNGQVYYLYNRVGSIEQAGERVRALVPGARVRIAHGRLKEQNLLNVMGAFKEKKFDVLVATTIIENGIDIPNVNTIIVEDASMLGLSQAYQIRGRVGRSGTKARAYFLYGSSLSAKATLRLEALKEAEELGSGYRLALRDMEMRGAGNMLGKEQSGAVNTIGLNLYCQMLGEAVERLKE